jgi:phosphate-selective porin OprO/OprP
MQFVLKQGLYPSSFGCICLRLCQGIFVGLLFCQETAIGQYPPVIAEYPPANLSSQNNAYQVGSQPQYPPVVTEFPQDNALLSNNAYPFASPQPYPATEYFAANQDVGQQENKTTEENLAKRIEALEQELKDYVANEKQSKEQDKSKPVIKPRGRLHSDANWFHQSPLNRSQLGNAEDGVFARRARLGFDGYFMDTAEVRLDFEMGAIGHPNLFDAYGNLLSVPYLGTVRLGHFREPFSLEAQTSSNYYTFMERAYNTSFDPSRNWGIMFYNHNDCETLTWALGAFRDQSNPFGADVGDAGGRAVTGRSTWLPYFSDERDGDNYWAIGSSFSYRSPKNDRVRYGVKPLNFLLEAEVGRIVQFESPNILSAAIENVDSVQLYGVETTRTIGPLNLQAEYIGYQADAEQESFYSYGSYAQASYFLTGEHRRWNRELGTFAPTKVTTPFLSNKGQGFQGTGAWEIALRWCDISIASPASNNPDSRSQPGYSRAYTAGLNWYLNDNVRMMANASLNHLYRNDIESDLNVFHTRLDIHF